MGLKDTTSVFKTGKRHEKGDHFQPQGLTPKNRA